MTRIIQLLFGTKPAAQIATIASFKFWIGDIVTFAYGNTTAVGVIEGGSWDSFDTFWTQITFFVDGKMNITHMPIDQLELVS